MNCQQVLDFLSEYLDGTLPWWQQLIFRLHLCCCSECRRYLASFQLTRSLSRQCYEVEPQENVPDAIVQAILMATKAEQSRSLK